MLNSDFILLNCSFAIFITLLRYCRSYMGYNYSRTFLLILMIHPLCPVYVVFHTFHPCIYIMIKIAWILPVTCECERVFSCMRRPRTLVKPCMNIDRMGSLAIINIHKNIHKRFKKRSLSKYGPLCDVFYVYVICIKRL